MSLLQRRSMSLLRNGSLSLPKQFTVGATYNVRRTANNVLYSRVPVAFYSNKFSAKIQADSRIIATLPKKLLLENLYRPRALYFQASGLSTLNSRRSIILREDQRAGENQAKVRSTSEPKESASVPSTASTAASAEPKMTLMEKIKHEASHYWHGTKLFGKELKISSKLVIKVVWGGKLTRREQRQLRRTFSDTVRLVPFLLFVIIPFAELLLPVALKLFPNMLPSTYEDKASAEKKLVKLQKIRNEMSRYLKETIAEMAKQRAEHKIEGSSDELKDTNEFISKIRSSGEAISTTDLLRVAHIFEDDLTLDNLTRPQLVSICRYIGVNAFGTDNYLKYQITNRMRYIRADDKMIRTEGIDSLSVPELQVACQSRGIRCIGVSPAHMRAELDQWIELHLKHDIPATLLVLSRIIALGEPMPQQFSAEALQATISSLPENLINEATLRLAEATGSATTKHKLEVLEEQEELIEDEYEQDKEDVEMKKQKKATKEKDDAESSVVDANSNKQSTGNSPAKDKDSPSSFDKKP